MYPEYGLGFGSRVGTGKVLYLISGAFSTVLVVLMSQLLWVCETLNRTSSWKEMWRPQCPLTKRVVVLQLVADLSSDVILVLIPIRLIETLSSRILRRRLTWIFSAAIVTTIVSIPHGIFVIKGMGHEGVITGYVQGCVGLTACNLPVMATRLIKQWEEKNVGRRSKWRSIKSISLSGSARRGAEGTESGARSEAAGSSANAVPSTKATTEVNGMTVPAGWLRWDRDLRDENFSSRPHPRSTRPALTIDLSREHGPYHVELISSPSRSSV
ncbi:hypothetical protein PQX77_020486 [Marasmius sp. AFHP31]|nr:hypothetical protein PQX77_020486 [Marasmius sp. AFHP31]